MKQAINCIKEWKGEFEFIDDEGTIIYTNKTALDEIIEIAYLEGINEGMGYSCGGVEFEVGDKVLHLFENKKGLQTIDERLKELTDD